MYHPAELTLPDGRRTYIDVDDAGRVVAVWSSDVSLEEAQRHVDIIEREAALDEDLS